MWSLSKRLAAFCCASLTASVALLTADNAGCYSNDYNGSSYYDGSSADCCDSHWNFGAEFLLWKTHLDCLPSNRTDFVEKETKKFKVNHHEVDLTVDKRCGSSTQYPRHKWRPGLRLNLGYKQPDCAWDLAASWTYLYSKANSSQCAGDGQIIESAWASPVSGKYKVLRSEASGKWSLNYNVFEIGLGHTYTACECFVLRPHFDLKLAWIQQRVSNSIRTDVDFRHKSHKNSSSSEEELLATLHSRSHAKRDFFGVGPQFGFDASWDLGCGWNLFGKATAAILYARPKIQRTTYFSVEENKNVECSSKGDKGNCDSRNHNGSLVYNTSIGCGVGWSTWMCDNSYLVSVKLGWEHHLYFNQNNFYRGNSSSNCEAKGDLALYGLTLAAGIDF